MKIIKCIWIWFRVIHSPTELSYKAISIGENEEIDELQSIVENKVSEVTNKYLHRYNRKLAEPLIKFLSETLPQKTLDVFIIYIIIF